MPPIYLHENYKCHKEHRNALWWITFSATKCCFFTVITTMSYAFSPARTRAACSGGDALFHSCHSGIPCQEDVAHRVHLSSDGTEKPQIWAMQWVLITFLSAGCVLNFFFTGETSPPWTAGLSLAGRGGTTSHQE